MGKYVVYVNVSNAKPKRAYKYMNDYAKQLKKGDFFKEKDRYIIFPFRSKISDPSYIERVG